ncbi:MAG: Mur ligase family protein, partial [Patescibacteria group bacterium]
MPAKPSPPLLNSSQTAHNFLLKLKPQAYSTARIQAFLSYLNNPQDKFKVVHVAGTSGKGSTCQMIASILKQAGYKTGLTISPYLIDPLEKIQINNRQISEKFFINLVNKYKFLIVKFNLTYFEAFIALTFIYFARQKVDYAVVETGLGGRLDATNVFNNPALSIITNIGLDHTEVLGKTKKQIAREKSAIIKNSQKAITGSRLIKNAKYIDITKTVNIKTNLLGEFQKQNAILAIEACKFLKIPEKYIKAGLLKLNHFGRFTVQSQKPLIIIDGAHNPDKIHAFISSFKKLYNF